MKIVLIISLLLCSISANKSITIDLSKQQLIAKQDGKIFLISKVTTGRVGHKTPVGTFKILEKNKMHISNLYPKYEDGSKGGAKMPYMQRLTNSGIAIHAGKILNYPDSHGCIRLPYNNAMKLFKWTTIGDKVNIIGQTPFNDYINIERKALLLLNKEYKKKSKVKLKQITSNGDVEWIKSDLNYLDEL